jgi:large subunit ribosomal protein L9
MSVKVILNQNMPNLGTIGDVVDVRGGYARNFLIPRQIATLANAGNRKALEHQLKILAKKKDEILKEAKALAAKIAKVSVTVHKQVGEEERIFGTVTTSEIENYLASEGIKIDRKIIEIKDEIKKVGVYTAKAKLHPEVSAEFKVWVVAQ